MADVHWEAEIATGFERGWGPWPSDRRFDAQRKVLDAAAWTYVAAFITSLLYFLWHLLPLLTGRRDDS